MCKHILNAQVSIRAPCCQRFFDCPQCHAESSDHKLRPTTEMSFICKKCKRAFRVDLARMEEGDEYCPHCDNHYVIEAKTPAPVLGIEGEDARMDNRMLKDYRAPYDPRKDFHSRDAAAQQAERIDEGGVLGALRAREEGLTAGPPGLKGIEGLEGLQGGASRIDDEDLDWS